jgi:ABC-type sugar transport system substrate-binding protein
MVALVCLAAVAATGCGSSSKGTSGGSASPSTGSGSSANVGLERAKKLVAFYSDLNRPFPHPTQAFNPGKGRIGIISCGGLGTDCGLMGIEAQEAAKAMGWTATSVYDGKFTPAVQSGYIQQLIQQHVDGILLTAIDANNISAAVSAAAKAKIPIACIACVTPPKFKREVIDVTTGGTQDGEAVGAWVVANSNGKGSIVAYNDPNFAIVGFRKAGAQKVIDANCADCKYQSADFPVTDITKPGPPTWSALLSSHPKGALQYVMGPYDAMTLPSAKTAMQLGRTELKITGFDAAPGNVQLMANPSSPLVATSSGPYLYAAWAAVDELGRVKAGKPTWDATHLPVALVTKQNVSHFEGPKQNYFAPPGFRATFQKLWGKA